MNNIKMKEMGRIRVSGTSIIGLLLALPLLAAVGVCAGRPIRVELHVQLSLPPGQFIILGLFIPA